MFSCPADHVPDWQPRTFLGMVEARSVNVKNTHDNNCRESAGTGSVNLKVVPVTGAALAGHHGPINMRLSFPHPLHYRCEVVILIVIVIAC